MKKVCVVFGGNGREREVSISSSRGILEAVKKLGYDASELDFDEYFIDKIQIIKPDVVFNAMHGTWGEDGVLPVILDFLHIPYTHSGHNASVRAMNKEFTKQVAKSLKVPVLNSRIYSKEQILQGDFTAFPVSFLKPCSEGSTICCVKFEAGKGLSDDDKMEIAKIGEDFFLIEEFFAGFDVTIGVLGGKTIGGIEIRPKSGYYDYLAKYTKGQTEYFLPPRIPEDLLAKMEDATLKVHNAIGAKSVSRADFLVKGDEFRFLEINTHPGFTETSLVPKMAKAIGISFEEVVDFLIKDASFKNYNK